MTENFTVIVVGKTEVDQYGNLLVTPQGGGDKIKIAAKRSNLHPLFQQGRAIKLDWQTYMNKPYVADAVAVEGELPPPTKPKILPEHQSVIEKARADVREPTKLAPQEVGMWWKELGEMLRVGDIDKTTPQGKSLRIAYYTEMSRVLGINIKEVQPIRKSLVEEAKRLGAKEIVKGE